MRLAEDQLHSPLGCHNAIFEKPKSRKNQPQREANTSKTKTKQKHPKRKIGIVNKASSVEKDVLCIMVELLYGAREQSTK
jgi:hypothetical protein